MARGALGPSTAGEKVIGTATGDEERAGSRHPMAHTIRINQKEAEAEGVNASPGVSRHPRAAAVRTSLFPRPGLFGSSGSRSARFL